MRLAIIPCLAAILAVPGLAAAADTAPLLAQSRRSAGKAGNAEAARAWQALSQLGPAVLPDVLAGLDTADAVAANWLRTPSMPSPSATRRETPLARRPAGSIRQGDAAQRCARRLAYEWLVRVDAKTPESPAADMLNDPGPELRRDAVARGHQRRARPIRDGRQGRRRQGLSEGPRGCPRQGPGRRALPAAEEARRPGRSAAHFGFIRTWQLDRPVRHTRGVGFTAVYPPEKDVDLAAIYPGKGGAEVALEGDVPRRTPTARST